MEDTKFLTITTNDTENIKDTLSVYIYIISVYIKLAI